MTDFGRVLRTGLLGKARALFHGLGPKGEYPSRAHVWEPYEIPGSEVLSGGILFRTLGRKGDICTRCGVTDIFADKKCVEGKYFSR